MQTSEPVVDPSLREQFAQLAPVLALAVRVLRLPSLLLGLLPVLPLVVLTWLASGWDSPARQIGLVVAALGGAAVVFFLVRRARYLRATQDVGALAEDLVALTDLADLDADLGEALRSVIARGGLRVMSRIRGFWKLVSFPSRIDDHVDSLQRLRWFLPPLIGTTVTLVHLQIAVAVVSWTLLGIAVPGSLLGLL
ncbi:hypothetical protein [Georgenia soli]|uniref:hypothetical protein n=1 Tax=Georgenia soli TaxID=638953 RepID=UPI000BF7F7EE|nr:hypothetical protein [Georgenia soli]